MDILVQATQRTSELVIVNYFSNFLRDVGVQRVVHLAHAFIVILAGMADDGDDLDISIHALFNFIGSGISRRKAIEN